MRNKDFLVFTIWSETKFIFILYSAPWFGMMLPDSWNNSLHCFFLQHCWSEEFKLDKTKLSWWWGEMADIGRSVFQKWPNCSFLRDPSLGRMYIVDKIIFCWTSSLKPPKLLNVFKSSCSRRHSDEDHLILINVKLYFVLCCCVWRYFGPSSVGCEDPKWS